VWAGVFLDVILDVILDMVTFPIPILPYLPKLKFDTRFPSV